MIMFQAQAIGGLGELKSTDNEAAILLSVRNPLSVILQQLVLLLSLVEC